MELHENLCRNQFQQFEFYNRRLLTNLFNAFFYLRVLSFYSTAYTVQQIIFSSFTYQFLSHNAPSWYSIGSYACKQNFASNQWRISQSLAEAANPYLSRILEFPANHAVHLREKTRLPSSEEKRCTLERRRRWTISGV